MATAYTFSDVSLDLCMHRGTLGDFFFNVAREIDFIIECCPQVGSTICSKSGMLDMPHQTPSGTRKSWAEFRAGLISLGGLLATKGKDRWGHSQGSRWLQQTRESRFTSHLTRAWGERELAASAPDMARLLIPHEPKTFLCSDRESAGRDDHRSQTCEAPQGTSITERIAGARKRRSVPWFCLPRGGTVTNPMFFLSLHLYNGDMLPDSHMKLRQRTEDCLKTHTWLNSNPVSRTVLPGLMGPKGGLHQVPPGVSGLGTPTDSPASTAEMNQGYC